jgi:cytochrome P450
MAEHGRTPIDSDADDAPAPPPPTGLRLTPLDPHFLGGPYPLLAELRAHEPVHRDVELNRWVITSHEQAALVLRDDGLLTDPTKGHRGTFAHWRGQLDLRYPQLAPFADDREHSRLRDLIDDAFGPAAVERFKPRIGAIVTSLLDDLEVSEFEVESIGRYASPIATRVMAEYLGIDPTPFRQIRRLTDTAFAAFFNPFRNDDEAHAGKLADAEIEAMMRTAVAAHRSTPMDDAIGAMIRAAEGTRTRDDEIVSVSNLLLVLGCVNTADFIANGIRAFLQNTRQLTKLRDRHDLVPSAVEEVLRFDSPVLGAVRIADRDMRVGTCPVRRGETIAISIAGANRDDRAHPNPDRFDIERADTPHIAFGAGRHACPGEALARAVATEALVGIITQFPQLELSPRGWEFASVPEFRRMKYFWIRT